MAASASIFAFASWSLVVGDIEVLESPIVISAFGIGGNGILSNIYIYIIAKINYIL